MQLDDLTIEVRDGGFGRVGIVTSKFKLEASPLLNQVGSWTLTLAADDPLVSALREPGSGIVVSTIDDVLLSGPTTSPQSEVSLSSIAGEVTFTGVCDNIFLADRLAYASPATAAEGTNADYDARTGKAETVIHGYVNANAGPGAIQERRVPTMTMGTDSARGDTITKQARFDNLGELVTGIANTAGLRWRVVQRDNALVFETSGAVDRSGQIRLDTRNGTLSGYKLAVSAPTATHAIVGAQDVTFDRIFATVTTPDSLNSSSAWGRRIERFVNQTYSGDSAAFTQSATEMLSTEGATATNVQAVPTDDTTMRFGKDWNIGDVVSIVADHTEYKSTVTGLVLKVDETGVRIGAVMGDVTAFNQVTAMSRQISVVESRVQSLEANAPSTLDTGFIVPTFTAGWGHYDATFYERVVYHKVGDEVTIRGVAVRTSGTSLIVFTLPVGFRPPRAVPRIIQINNSWGAVTVNTLGEVTLTNSGIAFANGNSVSLDISFSVAQP